MNKLIASSIAGAALSLASMSASAITIGMTDVGGLDSFVASADLADSGLGTEVAFINSSLGLTLTQDDIFQLQAGTDVDEFCNDDDLCYVDFGANTNYTFFMLKFGADPDYPDHYLYRNDGSAGVRYAVYDRTQNGLGEQSCRTGGGVCVRGLSHVTVPVEDTRPPNEVPAPGVLGLLAVGLLGLAARARRR